MYDLIFPTPKYENLDKFISMFGLLHAEFDKTKFLRRYCSFIVLLKYMLLISIVIFLRNYPLLSISVFVFINVMFILYYCFIKPYKVPKN